MSIFLIIVGCSIFWIIVIKRKDGAFGIELFLKLRFGPTVLLPQGKKLKKTRPEFLTDFDESKEREENVVASITGSAGDGDIQWNTEDARIGKGDMPKTLFNDNAATSIEVGVDECVGQTFTNGLVDWCVVNAIHLFVQCERCFDIRCQM